MLPELGWELLIGMVISTFSFSALLGRGPQVVFPMLEVMMLLDVREATFRSLAFSRSHFLVPPSIYLVIATSPCTEVAGVFFGLNS